jgi:CRISPR/Cas system endoribonuclease Cas6 (RAMP superfamily)
MEKLERVEACVEKVLILISSFIISAPISMITLSRRKGNIPHIYHHYNHAYFYNHPTITILILTMLPPFHFYIHDP